MTARTASAPPSQIDARTAVQAAAISEARDRQPADRSAKTEHSR